MDSEVSAGPLQTGPLYLRDDHGDLLRKPGKQGIQAGYTRMMELQRVRAADPGAAPGGGRWRGEEPGVVRGEEV